MRIKDKNVKFKFNTLPGLISIIWLLTFKLWQACFESFIFSLVMLILGIIIEPVDNKINNILNLNAKILFIIPLIINLAISFIFYGIFGEKLYYLKYHTTEKYK